jgi:adenylate cyclase
VIQAWLPEIAAEAKHFGYLSMTPDDDGALRHYEPIAQLPEGLQPAEGLAAVGAAHHATPEPRRFPVDTRLLSDVVLDVEDGPPRVIPVDPFHGGDMLINYLAANKDWHGPDDRGPDGNPQCAGATCDKVSLSDVIEGKFDHKIVEDKVVFIGVTAQGTFDQRVTPFDSAGPGVFVHMSVAEDIISNRFIDHPGYVSVVEALMMLLVALIFGLVVPRLALPYKVAAFPVSAGLFLIGNFQAFKQGHQLITVMPVMELAALTFGVIFFEYMTTEREKRQVRSTFQHYLSNAVMEKELTVFFSDIRGFTTLSEMLQPDEVSKMLNEYLTPMTDLVFEHKGTVDKYMGDAIMSFWGAPLDQPDHALQACKTSVAMLKQLDVLRAGWKAQGKPDIDIGIGLNSGMISVGNMGSTRMFNYTVIGDDVNLASRLEGTNKTYGTRIILGENTYKLVKGQVVARELGGVMVKGKKKPVTIFELREIGLPSPEEAATIALFEKGLTFYRARQWDEAEACLKQVMEKWPGDGPSEKYLDDIEDKRTHPPPDGWDGTYVMKTK